ncbi:endo-1,4-beta-xylanase [Archangium violaceum]|nr:endo-1,4-beta-xylanase [Archangium violaceum]
MPAMAMKLLPALGLAFLLSAALAACGGSAADSTAVQSRKLTRVNDAATAKVELLQAPYNWSQFSGTGWDGKTLTVVPLDRKIRPKTSGKWYLNPPINLMGPRLDFTANFSVEIEVDAAVHPDKGAFVDLYGSLPIGYDEWRIDGRNVRLGLTRGVAQVWVDMIKQDFSAQGLGPRVTFGVNRQGTALIFSVNGKEIGRFKESDKHPVFSKGKLYFGADAELGGGFSITSIKAQDAQIADNGADMLRAYTPPADSLRSLAQGLPKPLWIGAAANADALLSDAKYGQVLAENYSMITPEMHFKFQAIHPQPDQYAFAEADALVAFAAKNNMRVHGHTLVWHEALPQWIWSLYDARNYPALRQALMDHITTLVTRYKGSVHEWDTLNEIFSTESDEPYGLRSGAEDENNLSVWYKAFGLQIYIDALRKVKEIDPSAENWINEFGIDQAGSADKLDNMIAFVRYINGLGYGKLVDGIGFQSHNYDPDDDPALAADLRAAMQRVIAQAHVKVRVSELDVSDASSRPTLFSDKLAVCLQFQASPGCESFGTWGFTDRYGSMSGPVNAGGKTNYLSPNWGAELADSLPFDESYGRRSAVDYMRRELKKAGPPSRSGGEERGAPGSGQHGADEGEDAASRLGRVAQ